MRSPCGADRRCRRQELAVSGGGALESGLVRKWVRQRCQEAPGKTVAMASSAPDRRSEVTNWTPPRPSAVVNAGPPARMRRPSSAHTVSPGRRTVTTPRSCSGDWAGSRRASTILLASRLTCSGAPALASNTRTPSVGLRSCCGRACQRSSPGAAVGASGSGSASAVGGRTRTR